MPKPTTLDPTVRALVEKLGGVTEREGMPRIAGMIFALMLVRDEEYTLADLKRLLQTSHGSVSSNTRMLEDKGVLERVVRLDSRRARFRLARDPYSGLWAGRLQRLQEARAAVAEARAALLDEGRPLHPRLDEIDRFYDIYIRMLEQSLAIWQRLTPMADDTGLLASQ